MPTCQFCNKSFPRKYNFNVHQQTAKYCLKLQSLELQRLKNIEQELNEIIKEKANKELEDEVKELKKQLQKKDDDLKELVLKVLSEPRTVINNNRYKLLSPFRTSSVSENMDKFTKEHFQQGQRGVAYFVYDNVLIDKESGKQYYYCTDTGRKKFIMKDEQGAIVKDCKSVKLTDMLIEGGLVNKSKSLYNDLITTLEEDRKENNEPYVSYDRKRMACVKNLNEIQNLETNNEKFVSVLSTLVCNSNSRQGQVYEITQDVDDDDFDKEEEEEEEEDEEEDEEEEDMSRYTEEYFKEKEAFIENYRGTIYNRFKETLEKEKLRAGFVDRCNTDKITLPPQST